MNDIDRNAKWDFLERPRCKDLDLILGQPIPCLDHGFIRLIDYMGDEAAVAQAARVSYGKGTTSTRKDARLIRYLLRHDHTTPFEMCEIKVHVKLPVFVARQWIRHRTASVNEYSARYSVLANEFYAPSIDQMQAQSTSNKQGREGTLSPEQAQVFLKYLATDAAQAYAHYEEMVGSGIYQDDGNANLARELARTVLPNSIYTEWYWKVNLHNLLHFLRLRMDSHAQYEIRVYADALAQIVSQWVPNIWDAFLDYRLNAHTFSGREMEALRGYLQHVLDCIDNQNFNGLDAFPDVSQHALTEREEDAFYKALYPERKPE